MLPGLVIVCKRILEHDDADGMAAMEFFDELVEGELKMVRLFDTNVRTLVVYCIQSWIIWRIGFVLRMLISS